MPLKEILNFQMQKVGYAEEDLEDSIRISIDRGRLAIADGASLSTFSKYWADMLTSGFVDSDLSISKDDSNNTEMVEMIVRKARVEWFKGIPWNTLSWNARERTMNGSYATLLGVEFKPGDESPDHLLWQAVSVGDSCCFQVRGNELVKCFPICDFNSFNDFPPLVSSRDGNLRVKCESGVLAKDDRIIFATDTLSKWLLKKAQIGDSVWNELSNLDRPKMLELFTDLIEKKKEMRNDDITLAFLQYN
jgi:hypothetical protein